MKTKTAIIGLIIFIQWLPIGILLNLTNKPTNEFTIYSISCMIIGGILLWISDSKPTVCLFGDLK